MLFTRTPTYAEYLLGDPGYIGENSYIMHAFAWHEVPDNNARNDRLPPAFKVFNKRFAGKRVQVEWGIGALKTLVPILTRVFPFHRKYFADVFVAGCRLHNMVRKERMNMVGLIEDVRVVDGVGGFAGDDLILNVNEEEFDYSSDSSDD